MLVLCVVVCAKGFAGAMRSYAAGTQILFFSVATAASYTLSFRLAQNQKSVLALGMATRNVGAALAPLFAVAEVDQRAIVMVAVGVPMRTIASLLAALWFARRAQTDERGAPQTVRSVNGGYVRKEMNPSVGDPG